ncbi:MAG: tetratricopeptide repeat protein [Bacteroidota bacterium]
MSRADAISHPFFQAVPALAYFTTYLDLNERFLSHFELDNVEEGICKALQAGLWQATKYPGIYRLHPLLPFWQRQHLQQRGAMDDAAHDYLLYYQAYAESLSLEWQENSEQMPRCLPFELANLYEALRQAMNMQSSLEHLLYLLHAYWEEVEDRREEEQLLKWIMRHFESQDVAGMSSNAIFEYASAYASLGNTFRANGEYEKALGIYENVLEFWNEQQAQLLDEGLFYVMKAKVLRYLATSHRELKQAERAAACIGEAMEWAQRFGTSELQAQILIEWGNLCKDQLAYEESQLFYRRALDLAEGLPYTEATIYFNLGAVADDLMQWEESLAHYQRALAYWQKVDDKRRQAVTYQNMGLVADESRQLDLAIGYFKEAIPLFIELKDEFQEAQAYQNLALPHSELGRFEEALDYLHRALGIYQRIGRPALEAEVYQNMGEAHRRIGDYTAARQKGEQALAIVRSLPDRAAIAQLSQNIALIDIGEEQYSQAAERLTTALSIYEQISHEAGKAAVHHNMAHLCLRTKSYEKCRAHTFEAMAIYVRQKHIPKIGWLVAHSNLLAYEWGNKAFLAELNDYLEANCSEAEMSEIIDWAKKYYQRLGG